LLINLNPKRLKLGVYESTFYYFMLSPKQSFNAFLQSTNKSYRYNDKWINDPIPLFCEIKFDGEITIHDMLSNPIFSESSQGNYSIFRRFLEDILPDMDFHDFANILKEMYIFRADYLLSNRVQHTIFNERIFVNMKHIGEKPEKPNITFHTVKFEVFDEDNYETSFSIRSCVIFKIKELFEITKQNTQIQCQLKSIFQ
jgi:hypothetical protein